MILDACKKLQFPEESIPVLLDAEARILALPEAAEEAEKALDSLLNSPEKEYLDHMENISRLTSLPRMTVDMTVFLMGAEPLCTRYAEAGLAESLMWESLADLRYKLFECKYSATLCRGWSYMGYAGEFLYPPHRYVQQYSLFYRY